MYNLIMKIIAWNVNGIRSLLKTNYLQQLINEEDPSILCLGETKISCPYTDVESDLLKVIPKLKNTYWSPCKTRGGYSGTAIFSKKPAISVDFGLKDDGKELDDEGRVITLEFAKYYLVHVYTPNSGQALARLDFRTQIWDRAFEKYLKLLQKTKSVIVCGDLNVAHKEIDLKNPKTNLKTAGYTVEERQSFDKILSHNDLIDTYRFKNGDEIEYSFWSYMRKSREKNIGWRIDYFLVSNKLKNKIKSSKILTHILGSDHAPVKLKL